MSVLPPRPKLPPLNALRAFEVAARRGGFLAAAEELHVSPGAVSQHIKTLEDWAGAPLFRRQAQGVVLTELGANVAAEFSDAFDRLGDATRALRAGADRSTISIATLPAVAELCLAQRLPALQIAFPDLDVSISALETRPNLRRDLFDLSMFLDVPNGGPGETVLSRDELTPVMSPGLARNMSGVSDLANVPWIADSAFDQDWQSWLKKCAPDLPVKLGVRYSLYSLAVSQAIAGAGVLIGHTTLVAPMLAEGILVAPFQPVKSPLALCLETAGCQKERRSVLDLVKWLKSQFGPLRAS